jgi:hypothetical protein
VDDEIDSLHVKIIGFNDLVSYVYTVRVYYDRELRGFVYKISGGQSNIVYPFILVIIG